MINRQEGKDMLDKIQGKQFLLSASGFEIYQNDEFKEQLRKLENHVKNLDVLAICYNGRQRSVGLATEVKKMPGNLQTGFTGLKALETKIIGTIPVRSALGRAGKGKIPENIMSAITDIGYVISKAKRIAMYIEDGELESPIQKALYTAIYLGAQNNPDCKFFQVSRDNGLPDLFNDLENNY